MNAVTLNAHVLVQALHGLAGTENPEVAKLVAAQHRGGALDLSRRGFLGSLAMAAAGAAISDKLVWLPDRELLITDAGGIVPAPAQMVAAANGYAAHVQHLADQFVEWLATGRLSGHKLAPWQKRGRGLAFSPSGARSVETMHGDGNPQWAADRCDIGGGRYRETPGHEFSDDVLVATAVGRNGIVGRVVQYTQASGVPGVGAVLTDYEHLGFLA